MELVSDGDLKDMLKTMGPMSNPEVFQLARHRACALLELNSINIIHRDIKPANILVSRSKNGIMSYKLTDFGVSRFIGDTSLASTLAGSPGYWAPEVVTDKHDARCDVFSLGVKE